MNKDETRKFSQCTYYCPDCKYFNGRICTQPAFITEQEKEIEQLKFNISQAQDQILATAQKNQEYREQQIKQAKQETAREILQRLWEERNALGQLMILETDLTKLAKEKGIELE